MFGGRRGLSPARLGEDRGGFLFRAKIGERVIQPMVGQPPSHLVEEIVPLSQGIHKIAVAADGGIGRGFQALHPGIEHFRQVNVERLIGPEGGEHLGGQAGGRDGFVARQVVGRVVGGADGLHMEALQNAVGAQVLAGKLRVSFVPDSGGGGFVQQFVDPEVALQLQVGPVVERIAQRLRHGARPSQKLVARIGITCAEPFVHAAGSHGTPFVVIPLQPDFEQISELPVGSHILRRQVAMVVQDRLRLSVFCEEAARRLGAEEKIIVDERHGFTS